MSTGIGEARVARAFDGVRRSDRGYRLAKRGMDVALSLAALVALAPVLAAIAIAVKAGSRGPVLFRQQRVGLGGRTFAILKFRSMITGAAGPSLTAKGDARVTRVGRFLRRRKLDELPQLWNVLAGDMSLVGPRPEVQRYVRLFPDAYARILTVRPGLTDFAALEYRDEESTLAAARDPEAAYTQLVLPAKISLYHRYLDEMSLRTDVALVLRTLAALLR
jgi:lipopolysaccharide/colanic/teichoic acid biosynthesis glycosyltransferase